MANTKITDLTSATAASGDEFAINDVTDTSDKKVTAGSIIDIINGDVNVDSTGASTYNPDSIVNADINTGAAIVMSKITGTKAQFDTALSDDDFAYIGQANIFTANQRVTGRVSIQQAIDAGKTLAITIPDDTQDEGMIIQNTDGSITLQNAVSDANSFSARLDMASKGADVRNIWRGTIPAANDAGSEPVIDFIAIRSDTNSIITRPLLHISNKNTTVLEISANGDMNLQGNNIDNGGVIFLTEQAEADADVAGKGQIWVDNTTPQQLKFTDEDGTDTDLLTSTGISNIVEDVTPQLGADLDCNAFDLNLDASTMISFDTGTQAQKMVGDAGGLTHTVPNADTHDFIVDATTVVAIAETGVTLTGTLAVSGILDTLDIETATVSARDGALAETIADSTGVVTFAAKPVFGVALTILGTIATGVWNGTAVASAFLDADTAHLTTIQTFTGAKTFNEDITMSTASILSATDVETGTVSANDGSLAITIADTTGVSTFVSGAVLVAPVLGTPASGTLTNCTGLPEAGLVDNAVTLAKMAGGTDGNLISYDTSGDPAAVATGTVGQILTSGGAGVAPTFQAAAGGGQTFARIVKKADETVNSSTVLQDDDEILFAANASKTYYCYIDILLNSGVTPDFKWGISVPTDATAIGIDGYWKSSGPVTTRDVTSVDTTGTTGNNESIHMSFRVINATNAGNVTLQWAQNTSDAGDTKVLEGSTMVVWEETA